jgi:hypothetical protein
MPGLARAISRARALPAPNRAGLPAARRRIAAAIEPDGPLRIDAARNLVLRDDRGRTRATTRMIATPSLGDGGPCEDGCFAPLFAGDPKRAERVGILPPPLRLGRGQRPRSAVTGCAPVRPWQSACSGGCA